MPSIGQGTRFECRILDHYYENFEEKVKNKALNEKLKFGTNCIAFLDLFYVTYVKIGFGDMIPLNKPRYVGTAVLGLSGVENIKNVVKISY